LLITTFIFIYVFMDGKCKLLWYEFEAFDFIY